MYKDTFPTPNEVYKVLTLPAISKKKKKKKKGKSDRKILRRLMSKAMIEKNKNTNKHKQANNNNSTHTLTLTHTNTHTHTHTHTHPTNVTGHNRHNDTVNKHTYTHHREERSG